MFKVISPPVNAVNNVPGAFVGTTIGLIVGIGPSSKMYTIYLLAHLFGNKTVFKVCFFGDRNV